MFHVCVRVTAGYVFFETTLNHSVLDRLCLQLVMPTRGSKKGVGCGKVNDYYMATKMVPMKLNRQGCLWIRGFCYNNSNYNYFGNYPRPS